MFVATGQQPRNKKVVLTFKFVDWGPLLGSPYDIILWIIYYHDIFRRRHTALLEKVFYKCKLKKNMLVISKTYLLKVGVVCVDI